MIQNVVVSVGGQHGFVQPLWTTAPGCFRFCKVEPSLPKHRRSLAPLDGVEVSRHHAGGLRSVYRMTWSLRFRKINDTKIKTWCAKHCCPHSRSTPLSGNLCRRKVLFTSWCWAVGGSSRLISNLSDWFESADVGRSSWKGCSSVGEVGVWTVTFFHIVSCLVLKFFSACEPEDDT